MSRDHLPKHGSFTAGSHIVLSARVDTPPNAPLKRGMNEYKGMESREEKSAEGYRSPRAGLSAGRLAVYHGGLLGGELDLQGQGKVSS